jgi:hypothetical protein
MNNAFALQDSLVAHVSDGSLADIATAFPNVRSTPESGPHRKPLSCRLSAKNGLTHCTDKLECLPWTVGPKRYFYDTPMGAKHMFILIVAVALLFVMSPQVDAREMVSDPAKSETRPGAASLPSDEQLDALLAARNWEGLVTAFESVRSDESSVRALDWLDARINSGGGSLLGFLLQPSSMGHWQRAERQ